MTAQMVGTANLNDLADEFETAHPRDMVEWAVESFGPRLSLLTSMQDAVLIDIALSVDPGLDVVFIDTGYHFPETLEMVRRVRQRYAPNLRVVGIESGAVPLWESDPVNCCSAAKVQALETAVAGQSAWLSGLRRADSAERAEAPILSIDRRGLVKVNPLATWSDEDVATYIAKHDLPVNPLLGRGYRSIGCAPCTRPVADGEQPRDGRWAGSDKTECGIHL